MKVDLTQKEIDIIYFRLKDYIKISNNVDYLNELTEVDKEEFKKLENNKGYRFNVFTK